MKYYAVYKGKSGAPKIFTSWDECKSEVFGVKGAIYKSFTTEKEAVNFIYLNSKVKEDVVKVKKDKAIKEIIKEEGIVIYVDGSFSLEKENYSYGLVVVKDGNLIYKENGKGNNKEAILLRNVSGEVLGAKMAVKYALDNNIDKITIAYDYQGVECWAIGTWKRNNKITCEYHDFMQKEMKNIDIKFRKIKGHSGDKFNDLADKLAKEALGII